MEQIVKDLREAYKTSNKNEANIRFHVIMFCFLKNCGYDLSKCDLENNIGDGFCDIWYKLEGDNGIPIEVKRGDKDIKISDIRQVKRYADDKGVTFGILSNGYEFVLLDFTLKSVSHVEDDIAKAYVVFWFNIFKTKNNGFTELRYFKYMKYENLVENQITRYFSDIAQYRSWKLDSMVIGEKSWKGYKSTLFTFFELFGMKKKKYGLRCYEQISMDDFKEYIQKCKRRGSDTSKKTIENNYTHLSNFLAEMQKHNKIRHFNLDEGRKKNLSEYMPTPPKKLITEIRADAIIAALEYFETTRNATRNIAIFLLSISIGIERAQLNELKWNDIPNYKYIVLGERKIELYPLLQRYFKKLDEKRQGKRRPNYVFQTYYKSKYKPLAEKTTNDIFKGLAKADERWNGCSLQYVRNCLILYLFQKDFSIDEIIYITGIDINNISKYISTEDIIKRRKNKKGGKVDWEKLYDGILI